MKAESLIRQLASEGKTLSTAESCTGGLLGALLTEVSGASQVYLGGVVSYAYSVKEALLGVDSALLTEKGAVCEEVAVQMAEGVRRALGADFALSVTGNAGPGTDEKNPKVGEIFVACADATGSRCLRLQCNGSRQENRLTACDAAISLLLNTLK